MWTWASIPPGRTSKLETSSINDASALILPISQILPSAMAISHSSTPFSVTVFPFLTMMSKFFIKYSPIIIYFLGDEHSNKVDLLNSFHCPQEKKYFQVASHKIIQTVYVCFNIINYISRCF